jgi:Zn-dependent peptidase ImmA (M78 family)/transcriptional regulator with XRE-family HTH domain
LNNLPQRTQNLSRFLPERIKEAREARGFTLEGFAEALDVSHQALAQFESGQIAPGPVTKANIVSVTALPVVFFTTPKRRVDAEPRPFWRGLKRMEERHRRRIARRLDWAHDVCIYVSRFLELPEVRLFFAGKIYDELAEADIEQAAMALRDIWGMGRGPARDLIPYFEDNGVIVVREPVHCEDMDAVSCWQDDRPYVLISSEVASGPRVAYNLAHELGHLVLHAGVEVDSRNLDRIERQANRFAGAFLLPAETFAGEVLGTSIDYFTFLKKRWGVSIAAMVYRCKDLSLLSKNQHAYLMRQMNAMKIRQVEPFDDEFSVGNPSVLSGALQMLIEAGVQGRHHVRDAIPLNPNDVESLCGTEVGFLNERVLRFPRQPRLIDR